MAGDEIRKKQTRPDKSTGFLKALVGSEAGRFVC